MVTVISFARGERHEKGQRRLAALCEDMELPHREYDWSWIKETAYHKNHRDVFDSAKGSGYWAWKPIIILDALQSSDYVVYFDASIMFRNRQDVIDLTAGCEYMRLFHSPFRHGDWTKMKCFKIMGCADKKYYDAPQLWAGYIVCRNVPKTISIVTEWMNWCLDYNCVADGEPETRAGFKAHRHDQSILTNLQIKYNIPTVPLDGRFYDVPV